MASEAEIPESLATQAHQNVGSMKEDNQEKNHLAVVEGNNENTNGECFLYPPSVGNVAPEDMGKLSEDHQEPGLSEQEEITISKSNNQQMDSKSVESEEKAEQVAEKLSLHAEDKEAQKGGMLNYQEVESALHNGEPEADIEQVKKGSAEMNANVSNHNNLLEVEAVEIPISAPCQTSEVLENDKKSESKAGDQEKCIETTFPLDPMTLLRNVEAPGTEGEESLVQCSTEVAGSEEMAQSEKKLKDGDEETLSIGASVVSQTTLLSAESDEELISQTVKEVMEAGNQPPGCTIVEENICLQQVGKDTRFEEIGQDKTTINENLKDELKVENKNVESNEKGQEEDMSLDKTNNDETQILSSKTDREITTKENQKENSYDLVSKNQESLHPVEQHLALEPVCSEKERSSELIKAEECIEKQAMKQEETERRCQEETVKMVSEDVAPVEATKETTAPEEGEINVPVADSEIQEKGNDTLEVDNFGTSGVHKDNTSETEAKEMHRYENSNISENENYSSLGHDEVAGPSEKEDENQNVSSKFKPKEKEKQETEDSSEEKIHNLNTSEERKTTEPAISEGNLVEAATEKDLYSATSMVDEEKTEEFLISGAEKRQEDDDESVNLPMLKEKNESTTSEEDHTHEITKNIMSDYAQEMVESLQDEKTDGNLQHSRHQETAENNHSTEATLEYSVLEMADTAKDKLEDQKSTEKCPNPEASTTPLEGAPLETTDVSQILGKDSSIEKYEGSMEADNEILSPKKPPAEEKPKDITSAQAAEEIDDTCAPLKPTENNLSKPEQIDEELEQEPFTIDPEAHALNMRSQAGHEDHNSKESSEQMTANEAEGAVDLTCQQDNSKLNDFDKASSHFDEITNEENNNATPKATKEEIVDSLSKEESIIEKITEESTHSHHTIEESAEKVEAEIYQATGIENIQKQTSEEDSACGNQSTEPEKEETTKTRSVTDIAVAEKEGDDMQYGTSPTGAEEEETTLEKKIYHVKSSTQSDFTMESGMQETIDKTEVVQTYHDHTTFAAQQEEKSEKGDDLEEGNESILKEENIISKEEVPCSSGHTTSITQALETSLESSLSVELKDEHSSNVPLGQKGSSTCLNDEDDAIISVDIERVYDSDEIIAKDMVATAENTSEESVDKHTEDEKSNMMQETDRKREDVPRGTPTDNIPEDLGQVSSTELGTLTPEGGINIDENPSTENCRNDTQLHLEDQPTHSNNFNHMASDGTEKEQTNQEKHLNESTLEVDIVGNVLASSNTEAQVCPPIITDRPETEENNDIINKRSGDGNSDHGDQNQEINVQAIGAVVDAEDIIRGQDDSTNISNDRLQIPKMKEEASEGDNYNKENEGPINDDLSTEENTEPVDATEKRERCSESAIASKNSTSTESNELGTQETQTVEDQDAKSAVNGCLEENDKDQDISITKSTTKVDAQGSENIADGEKAAKEVEHEEETQSIKKGVEQDVHRVMEKKADDEDILETVNEDSSQHYDESNALESHKIELPKDGREHEQIRFSDIHETKPIEDNEIVHRSEENSATEKGTKETLKASSHQDESISISNDSIQVFELQEKATPNIQLRNIKDEGPNSITDGVSARENFESVVTTDKIEHHTNSEADNSIISVEAKKFAPEENSRVMKHPDTESSEDLCQDVHKDQGSSATGLETEFKDEESVIEERNVNETAKALELKETQSFTKEVTEEIFQQVIMRESADDEEHSESNTAELDNIETQKGGNTHEQSGSSHFLGTDMVKGEETVNQSLEESNSGYNKHNQVSLQASMTNIDGENPVPINDEYTKISNVEIKVIKDQDETTICKQQDNPDNRVENTISHAVTTEEINDPTEVVEKVECGSEYINLTEATKGETEATSSGLNDPVANSAENLIMVGCGDAKTLSAEAADINLSKCSIEKAEDATQFTDELEANEESQISQRHTEEEDFQQATTGERIDYELENERNTCISDNMQVHEDEKINELNKSHEISGSYLAKDKEIASQSLVANNTSVELPNQLTSTVVETSGKNVEDKMGILIQDESHEIAHGKTQAIEVNDVAGTNAEGHTHENDVQETINSIPAEENPKQVDPVKDHECWTETTGKSQYSTRGEDTDFQVKYGSTSIHVEANEDINEEPGSSRAANTSEECAQLEGSQLCHLPKSDITVQGIKGEEEVNDSDEPACEAETVHAQVNDDLLKKPGASDVDINVELAKEPSSLCTAKISEEGAPSRENQSTKDVQASGFDIPKEGNKEVKGDDSHETACGVETMPAQINDDLLKEPGASHAEIKVDLPEEPDSLSAARTSEEGVPLGQSQSSEDVLTSDFDIPKEGNKEKGDDSEETACVVEIVHAQVHDDSLKETCASNVEIKVDLAEEQVSLSAAKKSEEGAPLEESQTFEDVQASRFDIPKEDNKEEEKGEYSDVTASGVEILHAQVNNDLLKKPGASDVEIKVDLPEEPDSLSAAKISEDAPSGKSQSSEDVLASGFNIPKESNKEEKGDESDETACGVETVHAQVNENLLKEPGTSDALDAAKMSEECASLAGNQSSKDVMDSEYDIPKEDTKEEEKQGEVCSKTAYKADIVDAGIKGNLSEEPDTIGAASLEESCFSEDASAAKMCFPNRDTNEDKQRAESGSTEYKTQTVDAKVKDDFDAEPVASIAAKTSEEHVAFEEIQSSEDVLVRKSDIQKEGTEEEKQGVGSSKTKLNIKKVNDETNSEEGHLQENTIKALQVSKTEENQQEIFRRELPTMIEEIKNLTAEKVTSPELLHHSGDENVKDKSSQEQLEQSSSRQIEHEQEATSATKDTEEKAMNIQALKEERPDDSYSEKKIADETERQLDDSNSDFEPSMQQSQELAENAGIRDKSSMGEPGELPLEFEGVNPPSDSETKNSESYTDSFSQDIINETELQFSSKSQQNSNVSLQTDATSVDQEQIDNSEQMSRHYGQELTKSEETAGERQYKPQTSELIASENQSEMDFEKHEATTCDTDREKNIEPADPLEKLISSSETLVSNEKSSELLNENWEKNAETSAEDEGQGAESAPNCIGDDVRDTTVFRIQGNETKLDECSMKRAKDTKQAAEELKGNDKCPGREATQEDFQHVTREITDYKVNSVTPKAEAPELPSHIIASKLEVEVQKNVKEHEVAGSNEIDGLNLEIKEEVINQGIDNGSNYDKPNQHTCIGVEASEQYSGSEKNIQNQDDSVEISNDTTEVIHIQEREEKGAEYHLNSVSEEEVKSVDKPYEAETVNAEEKDTSQKDLNGSSVVKTPEGWATQQEDDSEDVMSQEVDVSLDHLKEKQQLVACYNDMPKTENMILVKEKPHVQGNTESATDINSTVENEEEIPASDIIARELDFSSAVNDGKQYPTKVEEEENLAKRDTDADHSTENLMVDGTDGGVECSKVTSPMLSQDIEERTAADIIASQISLALEREEQLQQLSSEQLQEHEATTTVMGNNALDNHCPGENTTDTSLDETIRMSHLQNDGQTELGVPNLECELEKTDPEEHHKTISSELIDEHTSTMTSEAHGSTISDAEKDEDMSQASSSEETKAQSQYPDKQDSEISPEEDEKQPVLARANEIPDEKVLCHDPKVAQQDSRTKSPDRSEKAETTEEQDTSTKVNYSLVTGKTDEEAMKSYIVPHMPDVQEKPSEEKGVTIEDDKDKNLLETQQMEDIMNHENATIESTLVAEKEEIQDNYGSTHKRKQMEADTSKGASEEQDQIGSCPNKSITISESHGDKVDSLVPQDPVKENSPIAGTANSNIEEDKNGGKGCPEQKGEETNDTNTQSTPADSTRISSSDIMQRSNAQTCQTEKGEQVIPKEKTPDTEDTAAEEPQTDEEKEEGDNEIQADSDLKAPFITETMRNMDFKATHKKSHNILSGVGSKVKHSISKVKKAITCSSSQFASEEVIIKLNKNKKN